jgi:hypothetical protein
MYASRRNPTRLLPLALAATFAAGSAHAAQVTISQTLTPGWTGGFCSACAINSIVTRQFASFTVTEAMTLSEASFAIREQPVFGAVTSNFSVSIWATPLEGSALFEAAYGPGGYTTQNLGTGAATSGSVSLDLPAWTLDPGTYWISIFANASQGSLIWGTDGSAGDDVGFALVNGVWTATRGRNFGFSLTGETAVATPLPGTLGLLGAGLGVLGGLQRLRARSAAGSASV